MQAIATAGGANLRHQIQMFLRVWWMPDCGKDTQALLNEGMYNIVLAFYVHIVLWCHESEIMDISLYICIMWSVIYSFSVVYKRPNTKVRDFG